MLERQAVVIGTVTFIASSKKTVCDTVSFFNFNTFSNVYTCAQVPESESIALESEE
jgi:hypothetical protein